MENITVIRSNRKTLSLQVTEDCKVIVRAPRFCPQRYIDEFVFSKSGWIQKSLKKQKKFNENRIVPDETEIARLKNLARNTLPAKVKYYSEIMQVKPTGFKVTSAKKRFGSCSSKGSLCFSYMLMLYPERAIDYVVVHELAHIKFQNHSADFYSYIEKFMPDYKEREKLLNLRR